MTEQQAVEPRTADEAMAQFREPKYSIEDLQRAYAQGQAEAARPVEGGPELRAALADVERRIAAWRRDEASATERKDWPMSDRWRNLATGAEDAVSAIRAALAKTPEDAAPRSGEGLCPYCPYETTVEGKLAVHIAARHQPAVLVVEE